MATLLRPTRQRTLEFRGSVDSVTRAARWRRPTVREFTSRLESEFGLAASSKGLLVTGLTHNDRLEPEDIRSLCSQLGLPAEDFGVES